MGAPGSVGIASLQVAVIGSNLLQEAIASTSKQRPELFISMEISMNKRCANGIGIILSILAVVLLF